MRSPSICFCSYDDSSLSGTRSLLGSSGSVGGIVGVHHRLRLGAGRSGSTHGLRSTGSSNCAPAGPRPRPAIPCPPMYGVCMFPNPPPAPHCFSVTALVASSGFSKQTNPNPFDLWFSSHMTLHEFRRAASRASR
ncbi:hypothetical protein PFISCL1PPCAC_22737 [Pristionchus fissidentatus]|uniref:Uncharacterized protein n=1 Tax=Pristionchus fissidentatus TaxID=1538716 RepID=A0AAV5WLN0_9BILA|nr:hypothetical protein PFISCL1PPCAC_22737 [Pristionchus fissidentatus]